MEKKLFTSEKVGKIMPQAPEVEKVVLATILLEKNMLDTARDILTEESFYDPYNSWIYKAILELDDKRSPIDLLSVSEQLKRNQVLETIGGIPYVAGLCSLVVSSSHFEYHCLILKDKYLRRKMISACMDDASRAFDDAEDMESLIAKWSREAEEVQEILVGKNDATHISEVGKQSIEQMHQRIADARLGISPGIPTGFADMDRLIHGWQKEKFIILAARPGVGKTSLAIQFMYKAAKRGFHAVFFSLEMGKTELSDKMIVGSSNIPAEKYHSGTLDISQWSLAEDAMQRIAQLPIHIDDNSVVTISQIVNKIRLLKKQNRCDIAFIDYLQLIKPVNRQGRTREQEVSEISRLLKVHARELKIPIVVLCQMNRGIEGDKREPRLSDLRESGSLEQDADIVLFIHRPNEVRDKETGELIDNYLELLIKKHRGGKTGKVRIKHNESMSAFYDWESHQ
ncbi:MAG: replicative DNA helicase [Bacteroidales bacterium]|nr:replicative DNA helicase [Bacteroidales bacterium]